MGKLAGLRRFIPVMPGAAERQAARAAVKLRRSWLPATLHPAQVVVYSFGLVILVATALLSLPLATRSGRPMALLDAFFTATSATCVIGLSVIDTSSQLSRFGEIVLLICIQIGGLGLMTFTTVFLVAIGKRLAIADRIAVQESFFHTPTGKLGKLILYIVLATVITEGAGAVVLTLWWLRTGLYPDFASALYYAIFHSVSAFCNAGFALFPDSAVRFRSDPVVLGVFSVLIIAGGLGFLVGLDIKEYLQQKFLRRFWSGGVRARVEAIRPRPRLSLHTKLVLTVSGALLAVGTISYYLLERNGVLAGMSAGEAWLNAWFCSVTARSAGYNTVDYSRLGGPALLCTMVLMFIGASPGSAGGGIKTSTIGLLVTYALFRWRGHSTPHAFGRSIPQDAIDRATSVVIAGVAVIILAASVLMGVEGRTSDPVASQARFLPVMFETFSAFGTTGLSMGLTATLTPAGKIVLCLLMFIGRIGPLTLALAIASRQKHPKYRLAEENVMVG